MKKFLKVKSFLWKNFHLKRVWNFPIFHLQNSLTPKKKLLNSSRRKSLNMQSIFINHFLECSWIHVSSRDMKKEIFLTLFYTQTFFSWVKCLSKNLKNFCTSIKTFFTHFSELTFRIKDVKEIFYPTSPFKCYKSNKIHNSAQPWAKKKVIFNSFCFYCIQLAWDLNFFSFRYSWRKKNGELGTIMGICWKRESRKLKLN